MRKLAIAAASVAFIAIAAGSGLFFMEGRSDSQQASNEEEVKQPDYVSEYIDSIADMHRKFPTDAEVVFIGDSRIQLPQWQDMFPNASVANRGIGSDTLDGLVRRVDNLGIRNPAVVVLEMGVNDILLKQSLEDSIREANKILKSLKPQAGRTVVLEVIDCAVESCDRGQVLLLNMQMRALAQKHGAQYVALNSRLAGPDGLLPDYSHDGLHLNAKGYEVLVSILCGEIKELACAEKAVPAAQGAANSVNTAPANSASENAAPHAAPTPAPQLN